MSERTSSILGAQHLVELGPDLTAFGPTLVDSRPSSAGPKLGRFRWWSVTGRTTRCGTTLRIGDAQFAQAIRHAPPACPHLPPSPLSWNAQFPETSYPESAFRNTYDGFACGPERCALMPLRRLFARPPIKSARDRSPRRSPGRPLFERVEALVVRERWARAGAACVSSWAQRPSSSGVATGLSVAFSGVLRGMAVTRAPQERPRLDDPPLLMAFLATPCAREKMDDDPPRRAAEGHLGLDFRTPHLANLRPSFVQLPPMRLPT